LEARICIRIRIRVKSRTRIHIKLKIRIGIRIKVMRIHNTAVASNRNLIGKFKTVVAEPSASACGSKRQRKAELTSSQGQL
jgi:hypothetical protein